MISSQERIFKIARVNIKRAFGNLPLEAINKLTDKEILLQKYIGIKTFIYIRSNGTKADWK